MNFAQIPDPDTLPPEVQKKLLSTPWFNQMLDLQEAGVDITSDLMEKLATRPGAQGYKVTEFEMEPGRKSKALMDVATGELVPPDKLVRPDFQPVLKEIKDPRTGRPFGMAFMQSASSAQLVEERTDKPLPQEFAKAKRTEDGKEIGYTYIDNNGKENFVKKGFDLGDLPPNAFIVPRPGEPAQPTQPAATTPVPAPAPAVPATAKPMAPAAAQGSNPYILSRPEDFYRVPIGAFFKTPEGKLKQRLK